MKKILGAMVVCTGMVLATAPMNAFGESVKDEAKREIEEAFEEAEKEVGEEASEAAEEIGQEEKDAGREIDGAVTEAKQEHETPESLDEAAREMKEAVKEAADEAREAVDELRREAKDAIGEAKREAQDALEECRDEEKGHGGGGAFTIQFLSLDTDPLKDLNTKEADLRGKDFDFDRRSLVMIGGIGYYDIGGGTRVGCAGSVGYKQYTSDEYSTLDTSGARLDSAVVLRIWPAYIGFNLEKAFEFSKVTLFAGGLVGGGMYFMHKKFEDRTNPSAFIEISTDTTDDGERDAGQFGISSFIAGDIHGGISFALAPVFRLGIEPYVLFTYAPEGFGTGFGDFATVNPGVRVRFAFQKPHKG